VFLGDNDAIKIAGFYANELHIINIYYL